MENIDFRSWVLRIVTEGLGAAFGIAVVGFVAYTAVGVYQIKQENIEYKKQQSIMIEKINTLETNLALQEQSYKNLLEKRSKELREEIIKSNQVALDLVLDEVETQPPKPSLNLPEPKVQKEALKHRFREAQQMIQQQF
jgi:Fe2+ transport system protein B